MTGTAEGRSRCLPEVREDDSRLEREPRNQGCCPQTPGWRHNLPGWSNGSAEERKNHDGETVLIWFDSGRPRVRRERQSCFKVEHRFSCKEAEC